MIFYIKKKIFVKEFKFFRISATYEMRTTKHGEICISNDNQTIGEEGFYMKRKGEEREQTDGETERERACVCVCVCWSAPKIASVDIHKQREIEKHIWL
jgi:hypothetical protein